MMHKLVNKGLLDLDVSKLKKYAPERLQAQTVAAVVLALGSNYQTEHYLPRVRKNLAALGNVRFSTAYQNPDFTATTSQPKPDYTNQCVYLSLTDSMSLQQLQQTFKQFEGACDRERALPPTLPMATNANDEELPQAERATIRQVTMDIDILLIELSDGNDNSSNDEWIIMADRYPFKAHESAGVMELVKSGL